ncbi:hypothetical protein [Pseudomonas typographi]|uniref:hypothetical protein n=1 Tax=Pseudomonas typographi TaxID=2715964 RepID=UPI0016897E60|nr:hypothetical protein [Pseudomonas typographi]MBD1551897.1 hypothetical protein [Pseudomonas typographi]
MPSPRKQLKQKRRATTKAKEKRIARNGGERQDPFASVPSDNPMNEAGQVTPDLLLAAMEDSGELLELFGAMAEAHKNSQQAMCEAFLQSEPMTRLVQLWGEQDLTDFIFGCLVGYKQWRDDADEDAAVAWVESETFLQDYVAASEAIAAGH